MKQINLTPETVLIGAGVLVGGFLLYKAAQAVPAAAAAVVDVASGIVTGNNAVTQNQTNAAGEQTTAYQGGGILGTMGAAANSASGGWLATAGENLGGWIYDTTHPASTGGATGTW